MDKNCAACAHSYMGPGDDELVCGHNAAGMMGKYARVASEKGGHCGPDRKKFEQHPNRNEDGSLKSLLLPKRVSWICACGAITFAVAVSGKDNVYLVSQHLKPDTWKTCDTPREQEGRL